MLQFLKKLNIEFSQSIWKWKTMPFFFFVFPRKNHKPVPKELLGATGGDADIFGMNYEQLLLWAFELHVRTWLKSGPNQWDSSVKAVLSITAVCLQAAVCKVALQIKFWQSPFKYTHSDIYTTACVYTCTHAYNHHNRTTDSNQTLQTRSMETIFHL